MLRNLNHYIPNTLSVRLSLVVVSLVAILFTAALLVMLHYSWRAVKDEGLHSAVQTLSGTMQHIDNTLHEVELATRQMQWNVEHHLDDPDRMFTYSRKMLEVNPNITGCAIAFEPFFYPERGEYFMAYSYHPASDSLVTENRPIIQANLFGNQPYNQQDWYTATVKADDAYWTDPLKDDDSSGDPITSYCLPIHDGKGKVVGVIGVDLSLKWLSATILAAKSSPNSYCTLLGRNGTFIVHPDSTKLFHQDVFTQIKEGTTDPTVKEAAQAMVNGESDYKFFRMKGKDYCVFYKPFKKQGWSAGIILPKDDISGDYDRLLAYVLAIAIGGFIILLLLCWFFTRRQLMPLQLLTQSATRIADGHYDEIVPDSRQQDEIGRLQDNFRQMQQSLAAYVSENARLSEALKRQGDMLHATYEKTKEADHIKVSFLHYMTDQMIAPVSNICDDVRLLREQCRDLSPEESKRLVDDIHSNSETMTGLLSRLLEQAQGNEEEMIYEIGDRE
jgi:methyl-accepting chemotaxis protein/sigma-B regulation protein RsbU (phosphoserine phosphatase)